MPEKIDILLPIPTAVVDFPATYVGFLLALGIFFAFCLANKRFLQVSLIVQAVSLSGFASGRLIGLVIDGMPRAIVI